MRLTEVVKGGSGQRTLLSVSVEEMRADVIDRSWDSQGTVTIGNVSVLDHISLGEEEREVEEEEESRGRENGTVFAQSN